MVRPPHLQSGIRGGHRDALYRRCLVQRQLRWGNSKTAKRTRPHSAGALNSTVDFFRWDILTCKSSCFPTMTSDLPRDDATAWPNRLETVLQGRPPKEPDAKLLCFMPPLRPPEGGPGDHFRGQGQRHRGIYLQAFIMADNYFSSHFQVKYVHLSQLMNHTDRVIKGGSQSRNFKIASPGTYH